MRRAYRPPDRDKYLVDEEVDQLLSWAKKNASERDYHFLLFAAHTGARPSEILDVRPEDFRWEDGIVIIRTLKQKKKSGPPVTRDIDASTSFLEAMESYTKGLKKGESIFDFSRTTAWRLFKKAIRGCGLRDSYSLYSLRHARAIRLLELTDRDLRYVQSQLGHSDINVTMNYLHVLPSQREEYRNKMR